MPTRTVTLPPIEVLKPSRPNRRDALATQLLASLKECIAWMDAAHPEAPLSRAIVADAKRVLDAAKDGAR